MRFFLSVISIIVFSNAFGQVTTTPEFPKADESITFTVDVTGTPLEGYSSDVWIWTWIDQGTEAIDAPTNVNPATEAQSNAFMTRSGSDPNVYTITFIPTDFFQQPANVIDRLGLLLKGRDWSDGQTPDYFVDMSSGELEVSFTTLNTPPTFFDEGETVAINASASETVDWELLIDGVVVTTFSSTNQISHSITAGTPKKYSVQVTIDNGSDQTSKATYFVVRSATQTESIPAGIVPGINYLADQTKAILCLTAPMKSSAYVIGDFTNWEINPDFQMKSDGDLFWVEITGLSPGTEYAFQYLVDESVYVADPYADKILDPDDQYILSNVYPGLKTFPQEAYHSKWYFNRLSVLETGQPAFEWTDNGYQRPSKESLVVYELLIRDFFGEGQKTYANLTDTLSYLKSLGINAIELMPIMEFNGNESWGYNPTFMLAPDKYYGPKDELKRFIDAAHNLGIAVILDIAMNHNDLPAPYALMYFDFYAFKPTAANPWFNTDAKHPFNVFFDYDHESTYTKDFLDSINSYWISEYKVDGFRFDLSKGFTQTNSGSDVGSWSSYDASRVALLKRMADEIWATDAETYVILEHFADNSEEKELAEYGMLLWGNVNHGYSQSTMGYTEESSISWGLHTNRGWSEPHLVSYMESHDEERLMYKNLEFGNSSGSYTTQDLKTGLERMKAASAFFYLSPGPKMLWQFGELGYDFSINTCPDGTINNDCRLSPKPIPFNDEDNLNYNLDKDRLRLKATTAALIKLKNEHSIFSTSDIELKEEGLLKQLILKGENYTSTPASSAEMNAVVVGNFDVQSQIIEINFPHTGTWFDYFSGGVSYEVSSTSKEITLPPGNFIVFTDVKLEAPEEGIVNVITSLEQELIDKSVIYPNPATDRFRVTIPVETYEVVGTNGQIILSGMLSNNEINVSGIPTGVYIIKLYTRTNTIIKKLIKR